MRVNNEDTVFLKEEEQGIYTPYEEESLESEDYKQGFENSIMEVHRQYDLRSKKMVQRLTPNNINDLPYFIKYS